MNGHPKFPELGLWGTIYRETDELIGRCGLLPWTIDDRHEVEIAYLLELVMNSGGNMLDFGRRQKRIPERCGG